MTTRDTTMSTLAPLGYGQLQPSRIVKPILGDHMAIWRNEINRLPMNFKSSIGFVFKKIGRLSPSGMEFDGQ